MSATDRQPIPTIDAKSIARRTAIRALLDAQLIAIGTLHYMPVLGVLPDADEWRDALAAFAAWTAEHGAKLIDKRDAETPCLTVTVNGKYFACLHIPDDVELEPTEPEPQWSPYDGPQHAAAKEAA